MDILKTLKTFFSRTANQELQIQEFANQEFYRAGFFLSVRLFRLVKKLVKLVDHYYVLPKKLFHKLWQKN
jgi:hypothetical protein